MPSTVFFIDMRASYKDSFVNKLGKLMEAADLPRVVKKRDLTAVKLHFGELGNTAFVRPVYLRKIVDCIKEAGAVPFLTDANTLYVGTRSDSPHHIATAIRNGFAYPVVDAPLIIADGLRGKSEAVVTINQKRFKKVYIGKEIVEANSYVSVAHFKGHELSGFGGAIKNTGMGCASRKGKLAQHSVVAPKVKRKKCVGCGECILICPNQAILIQWNETVPVFLEKMVEYTLGVLKGKENRALFVNFITDVSPACDCPPFNDAPIVRNIGVVASTDPIAIDQASVDLVNQERALPDSCLTKNKLPGKDKFKALYPDIDWPIQLAYGEKIGLGRRKYKIERL